METPTSWLNPDGYTKYTLELAVRPPEGGDEENWSVDAYLQSEVRRDGQPHIVSHLNNTTFVVERQTARMLQDVLLDRADDD